MQRQAVGAETESATPNENKELRLPIIGGGGGNRTRFRDSDPTDTSDTEPAQNCANSRQSNTLPDSASSSREQKPTLSRHTQDTSAHQKYVPSMYQNLPQDLAEVVEGWDRIPDDVKQEIQAMVRRRSPCPGAT